MDDKSNPATRSGRTLPAAALSLLLAAALFWVAYDEGSYGLTSRHSVAIGVLWALILGSAVALWPTAGIPRAAIVTGSLLAAFTAWIGLSAFWAESAEKAFNEFDRGVLYLAVFALAVVASRRGTAEAWMAGMALAFTAIGFVALASRLFPHLFADTAQLIQLFPAAQRRLSFPVGYWNGLATLLAFALPLLLYFAAHARPLVRGLAVAPIPALVATIYLTSSRGGTVAAALAVVTFVVLTSNRWGVAGATAVAGIGSAAAVAVLLGRDALVNAPIESAAAEGQGRSAALLIGLICIAAGVVYGLLAAFLPTPRRASRSAGLAAAAIAVAVLAGLLVASHPVRRFENFKDVPPGIGTASVREHLLSGSGNGRWQLWASATDEFRSRPLVGRGAGSYEAWWAEHGTLPLFVRDAHSLYLETLGELGLIGFALVVAALGSVAVAGALRLRGRSASERAAVAALLSLLAAFLFEAGIDWMWELPAVTIGAVVAAGLLTGPATLPDLGGPLPAPRRAGWLVPGLRVGVTAVALALVVAEAIPLLATMEVRRSQEAVARGDLSQALADATGGRDIQPWASTPYLQVALVQELAGNLPEARGAIEDALGRDDSDWRLWLVAARIQTKAGDIAAARRSLAQAEKLNPRSPLFNSG